MRTRLTILAALALGVLPALATQGPGPGRHGSSGPGSDGSGSAVDDGNRGSGSGDYADSSGSGSSGSSGSGSGHDGPNDDEADAGAQHETQSPDDNPTGHIPAAATPANPTPAAGPPTGRVADRQAADPRLSTTPSPRRTGLCLCQHFRRRGLCLHSWRGLGRCPYSGSAAVAAAVLVLAAMVAAGFRARARLGRLG